MSTLGPIQLAPENEGGLLAPFKQSPLLTILSALGNLPQDWLQMQLGREQLKQTRQQTEYGPQVQQLDIGERKAALEQTQRANAQQGWDTTGNILKLNPQLARDPKVKARLQQYADSLGIPLPLDANGDIDLNAFKIAPGKADPRVIEYGMALPAGEGRRQFFEAQGIAYTPQMISSQAAIAPKDQAALARAKSLGIHDAALDNAMLHRLQIQQQLADAVVGVDTARTSLLQSQIITSTMNAQAHMKEADAAAQNANTRSQEFDLHYKQFLANPSAAAQRITNEAARTLVGEARSLDSQINALHSQIITATNDNVDSGIIDQLNARLSNMNTLRSKLNKQIDESNTVLQENLGHAGDVRRQSGASNVTVTDIGNYKAGAPVPGEPGYKFTGEKRDGLWIVRGPDGKLMGWKP